MTLRTLKKRTQKTVGEKLPTAKTLRESMIPVVAHEDMTCGSITAYENGFAVYSSGGSETVLRIDECKDYTYRFDDGTESHCGEEVFLDSNFAALLVLIGEDRIEHNRIEREIKNGIIQLEDGDWIEEFSDSKQDFVEELENADLCQQAMSCLTDYQRKIIKLYFFENRTMAEIADICGIAVQNVHKRINDSLKKMKKVC